MARPSSNRKVARAAGIGGGRTYRGRTPWTYFGVIALILVLGVVGTVTSRDRRLSQINNQGGTEPKVGTTWHEGYAVYECGKFVPAVTKANNPQGITIAANLPGVILVEPKVKAAAGHNATLGKFSAAAGIKLNAAELGLPGGTLYQDGAKCGSQPGHVYVKQFAYTGATVGKLYNGGKGQLAKLDPRDVPLQDQVLITIAFVPASDASKIPPPPDYVNTNLNAAGTSSTSPTTTTPPATPTPTTTVPSTTSTTKPTTTTTAAATTTTTK
ncbi:MAG TPA: hypothetical protein VFV02_10110 [Acidimicrobiales bacterium]|nr:hypothetical protein [Acidimicrobiales bacterium]